jgi:hypothetical protein
MATQFTLISSLIPFGWPKFHITHAACAKPIWLLGVLTLWLLSSPRLCDYYMLYSYSLQSYARVTFCHFLSTAIQHDSSTSPIPTREHTPGSCLCHLTSKTLSFVVSNDEPILPTREMTIKSCRSLLLKLMLAFKQEVLRWPTSVPSSAIFSPVTSPEAESSVAGPEHKSARVPEWTGFRE